MIQNTVLQSSGTGYVPIPFDASFQDDAGATSAAASSGYNRRLGKASEVDREPNAHGELSLAALIVAYLGSQSAKVFTSNNNISVDNNRNYYIFLTSASEPTFPSIILKSNASLASVQEVGPILPELRDDGRASVRLLKELNSILDFTHVELAVLLNVSRNSIHKWLNGAPLRGKNLERLIQVLTHIKEASQLVKDGNFSIWLKTPISSGGPTPFSFLANKRFSTFRGLIVQLRQPIFQFSESEKPMFGRSSQSREAAATSRESINPALGFEDTTEDLTDNNKDKLGDS